MRLENADCLTFMGGLGAGVADLAILDPPYNVGAAAWDRVPDYLAWMKSVLTEARRVLKPAGSLYVWGTSRNNDFLRLKLWLDEQPGLEFKNWVVWVHKPKIHRKPPDRFLCKHEDLLFYAGPGATFNQIRDAPPAFQLKMHAGRYDETYFVPRDRLPPSQRKLFKNGLQLGGPATLWWLGPSNQSNGKKVPKFAGYKSEWVCERIVAASSAPGDVVLVPFAGTGTECVAARRLGRRFLACEADRGRFLTALARVNSEPGTPLDGGGTP